MKSTNGKFRIAAVQSTPVYLDRDACVDKACSLIAEAGKAGADLAVFPEGFIPGYPLWVWFVPAGKTPVLRPLYAELLANSVSVPDESTDRLGEAAREARVAVAIGIQERNSEASDSTVYCSLLYIGADGAILGKHRKLIPTVGERMVWGQGDGSDLEVHRLPGVRVSGLICWENYMPLARYTLYAQGTQVYIAPTWDRGDPWMATVRHIAKEGRCIVVSCCSPVHIDDVPDRLEFKKDYLGGITDWVNPGQSAIIDPDGKIVASHDGEEETILYHDVAAADLTGPKYQLDSAGHYARPDVFDLRVNASPKPFLTIDRDGTDSAITDPEV